MIIQDNRSKAIDTAELGELSLLAGKTLGELSTDDYPGLLVFPRDFATSEDLDNDTLIYSIEYKHGKPHLITNNIVGFIGFEHTQLTIRSRFSEENEEDYFLHYMLQKVLSLNIMQLKHKTADEQILDFLIYLFPSLLKQAMRQGLFKEYQNRAYDNANVKGCIDVSRFIRQDLPFAGHIAYHTREHSADNSMTQLIRHTIEYVKTKKVSPGILSADEETKQAVSLITTHTPSYRQQDRMGIIHKNLKPVRHPYFSAYRPLQRLCLQILRREGLKYGQANEKIQGVLFDAAWLWEEYLHTLLKPMGYEHPQNKKGKGAIYLFEGNKGKRYPDFHKEGIILDAKYKQSIAREDYHQMITYQYVLKGEKGYFISPSHSLVQTSHHEHLGKLNGYGADLHTLRIPIPSHCESYSSFCQAMKEAEKALRFISPHSK